MPAVGFSAKSVDTLQSRPHLGSTEQSRMTYRLGGMRWQVLSLLLPTATSLDPSYTQHHVARRPGTPAQTSSKRLLKHNRSMVGVRVFG